MTPTTALTRRLHRGGSDAGNMALEIVILAPALLLLISLLALAGRVAVAGDAVTQAAASAARQASIARTAGTARDNAEAEADRVLDQQGLACATVTVGVDTSEFARPVGSPAQVTATITCHVRLSDLSIPGLPGSRTVTATGVSPLDTYRARS